MPRAEAEDTRIAILQATYTCVARWGLSKTTIEDAAKEAGLSRATVYRYFPGGRDELISAVVAWEYARFFTRLYDEVHGADTLEEVMERGLMFAHRAITEHEVLQRILQTEPDVLLPQLTTESSGTEALIAAFLTPYLEQHGLSGSRVRGGGRLPGAHGALLHRVARPLGSRGSGTGGPARASRAARGHRPRGLSAPRSRRSAAPAAGGRGLPLIH